MRSRVTNESAAIESVPPLTVNGDVLKWARKLSGVAVADAARRIKISEDDLAALESGGRVAVKQSTLTRMSEVYRLPYGSLFMPSPLPIDEPKQFRTFRGK